MLTLARITDPIAGAAQLRSWRCGRIMMRDGKLVEIQRRLLTGSVSMAQVWWQAKYGRPDDELCWMDYHQPMGMPNFLTLDYVRSGQQAGYRTFVGAVHVLNEIARIRGAVAIVAHISNGNISDRYLTRMGWERHVESWKGRHWIRRFYDGYPKSQLHRYLPIASQSSSKATQSTVIPATPRPAKAIVSPQVATSINQHSHC